MPTVQELLKMNLGQILREKELTQVDFAKKVGVTFQTINGVMTGSRSISLGMITRIAKALKISESELLSDPAMNTLPAELRLLNKRLECLTPGRRAYAIETFLETLEGDQKKPTFQILEGGKKSMDLIPPDLRQQILALSEENRAILIQGIRDWVRLPDKQKVWITRTTADLSKTAPKGLVPKLKA